jgi:MerR family transcriptional regulator, light-induced transcriptional regulator
MISEAVYLHYLNSLLDGDKKQCVQIITNLIDEKVPIKEIYLQLFHRSMYRVGQLWEKERCSIADEHIATKITEGLLELVSAFYSNEKHIGKRAVVTCIDKEYHELGARMVAGLLEAHGWDVIFLGVNTPQEEILNIIRTKQPDIIGISSSFYINIMRLVKLIQSVKEEFPEQEIIVGGQAIADGRVEGLSRYRNVKYITCLDELEKYLTVYNYN